VNEAYLLRTYDHIYNPDVAPVWVTVYNRGADDVAIWQAARATTAAPFYFKPLEVSFDDGYSNDYRDGGIRENNPSYCAYSEHAWHHGDEKEPTVLLSVGAGQPSTSSSDALHNVIPGLFGLFYRTRKHSEKVVMFKNLIIKEMEGQDRHRMMRTIGRGGHTWYKRLDVTTGLEKMPIDQWESGHWLPDGSGGVSVKHRGGMTMNKIQIATEAYLSRNAIGSNAEYAPPRVMLQQTAEKLVRIRRAREYEAMTESGEKRERWEVYMGKYLAGEQGFFHEYLAQWDYAMLGRKATK
jgi:hypothetical protein